MVYQVVIQDEWNNLYHIGFYNKLEDSLKDVNDWLEPYNIKLDELKEYPSTFNMCFDTEIQCEEGCIFVRGFIFDKEELLEDLKCDT